MSPGSDIERTVQEHLDYLRSERLTPQQAAETIGYRLPLDGGWDDLVGPFAAALLTMRGMEPEK